MAALTTNRPSRCRSWIACAISIPTTQVEAPLNSWEQLREFKASLCRDLAALLNTRRAEEDSTRLRGGNQLAAKFWNHRLHFLQPQERRRAGQVRRSIERAIRQFEPRLARVTVSMEEPDPVRPVLRFHIDAVLRIGPARGTGAV